MIWLMVSGSAKVLILKRVQVLDELAERSKGVVFYWTSRP